MIPSHKILVPVPGAHGIKHKQKHERPLKKKEKCTTSTVHYKTTTTSTIFRFLKKFSKKNKYKKMEASY